MRKLTILCPCYNQEKFIQQTLDGFIRQKTNFDYVIVIGDDASSDSTPSLVMDYVKKYPEKFHIVLRSKNLGAGENFRDLLQHVSTEYVAVCEGDDYWTDDRKLQKQVDFLDANKDFSICFHPVRVLYEDTGDKKEIFPTPKIRFKKTTLGLSDILRRNFIQTNSVVYRWRFKKNDPLISHYLGNHIQPADHVLHLLHAEVGKIRYLDSVMGVYRRHSQGIWHDAGASDEWFKQYGIPHLNYLAFIEEHFYETRSHDIRKLAMGIYIAALNTRDFDCLGKLVSLYPTAYAALSLEIKAITSLAYNNRKLWSGMLRHALWRQRLLSRVMFGFRKKRRRRNALAIQDVLYSGTTKF